MLNSIAPSDLHTEAEHLHSFGEHDASSQNHLQHSDKYFAIKVVPVHFRFALHRHKPFNPMLLKHMLFKQGNLLVVCALAGLSGKLVHLLWYFHRRDATVMPATLQALTTACAHEQASLPKSGVFCSRGTRLLQTYLPAPSHEPAVPKL